MQAAPVIVDETPEQARLLVAQPVSRTGAIGGAPSSVGSSGCETTPLLPGRASHDPFSSTKRDSIKSRPGLQPRPAWALVPIFMFTLFNGASMSVLLEILNLVACRSVDLESNQTSNTTSLSNGFIHLMPAPAPTFRYFWGFRLPLPTNADWAEQCRHSVPVQKAAATFITQLTMLGGATGGVTLAYWGTKSDRLGRVAVLRITVFALMAASVGTILLVTFPEYLGMKWCALGVVLDGLLGGEVATGVLLAAYLSDCAPEGSRAQVFSVSEGFYYAGLALGPTLGSWAYASTGLILLPHYACFLFYLTWLVCLFTIVPESLSESQRRDERRKAKEEAIEQARLRSSEEQEWRSAGRHVTFMRIVRLLKAPLALLTPLAVLLPREVQREGAVGEEEQPLLPVTDTKTKKDWRLTLVALAYGLFMIVPGLMNVKILYTRGTFGWGPVETGYFITFLAICKLIGLLVLMPIATRLFRRKSEVSSKDAQPSDAEAEAVRREHDSYLKNLADANLDLNLARISIVVMIFAYIVPSLPHPRTSSRFLVGSGVASLAAAASPALQSLAVSLAPRRESGQVLASLSVLINLCVQFIGPPLFAGIYVAVVEHWPEAVFAVAAAWILSSLVPLLIVKLGSAKPVLV
ncbi:hypothetical protein ACM66B_005097 [Microbotryomycetes sp. NB124-2]